jgi:hypothetical protein
MSLKASERCPLYLAQERRRSDEYLTRVEAHFGIRLEPGRSADIQFMAHLWEPLRWIHKPLFVFLGAELMWLATDALLFARGFRVFRHKVPPPPGRGDDDISGVCVRRARS